MQDYEEDDNYYNNFDYPVSNPTDYDEIAMHEGGILVDGNKNPSTDYDEIAMREGGVLVDGNENFSVDRSYLQAFGDLLKPHLKTNVDFILGAGDALVNFPKGVANMIAPDSMQIPLSKSSEGTAYDIGEVAGDIAGFISGGAPLNAMRAALAGKSIPYASKIASKLGGNEFLPSLARRGIGSALYGAVQSPEERGEGALLGGGVSLATDSLLKGAGSIFKGANNYFRGNLTPKELKRNLEINRGIETGLGDIIGSPLLKRVSENSLSKNPFSGSDDLTARISKNIENRGNKVLTGYLGDTSPLEVPEKLGKSLNKVYQEETVKKNALYNEANKIADENNLKLDLSNFSNKAKEYSDIINDQHFLKYEPKYKKILNRLVNYHTPFKESKIQASIAGEKFYLPGSNEIKYPSLKEANILSGKLRELSRISRKSSTPEDRYQSKIFSSLSKSLKDDIKYSINNSGNEKLKSAYDNAEKNYANNFSSFLDKDIYQYLNGQKDAENLINDFIVTGSTSDKGNKLKKLMDKLPEEDKNLVKYSYLSRALKGAEDNRTLNPLNLATHWGDTKLGPRQRKALVPNAAEREELDRISELAKINSNSLNRMFNPHTGQRMAEYFLPIMTGYAGGQSFLPDSIPDPIAGGLGILGAGLVSRGASKFLHSPTAREAIVNRMIKNSAKKEPSSNSTDALKALLINIYGDK
jgi:hypothetical protein